MGIFDFFGKKNKKDNKNKSNLDKNDIGERKTPGDLFQPRICGGALEYVYNHNIKDGVFVVPKDVVSIESVAFHDCDNLETLVLHDGIKFIAPNAIHNCKNLRKIVGLSELTTMNNFGGFSGCSSLERVILPETTEVICDSAFYNCVRLNSVYIPSGCMIISKNAFENCAALQYLELPTTVSFIQKDAFKGCHNLTLMFTDEHLETENEEEQNNVRKSFDIQIAAGALNDVKTICAHDSKLIEKVIESGYGGVVSYFDDEHDQVISVDLGFIENYYGGLMEDYNEIKKDVSDIEKRYLAKYGEPSAEDLAEEERLLNEFDSDDYGENEKGEK